MNVLLDTCALIWWLDDNPVLSQEARDIIRNGSNQIYISAISIFEIRIKQRIGKLEKFTEDFFDVIEQEPFHHLSFTRKHAKALIDLPVSRHHKDPFDWALAAQCQVEKLPLLSDDNKLSFYGIKVIKAC